MERIEGDEGRGDERRGKETREKEWRGEGTRRGVCTSVVQRTGTVWVPRWPLRIRTRTHPVGVPVAGPGGLAEGLGGVLVVDLEAGVSRDVPAGRGGARR